ncbi:MAG: P-II family nitrogen regulator, partial [Novosphingobium sp.]
VYRGAEYVSSMLPKLKLEVAVPDSLAGKVVEVVCQAANNQEIGDGKVFVFELEDTVRIRTGERGELAL